MHVQVMVMKQKGFTIPW